MDDEKKLVIERWLIKAEEDLRSAKSVLNEYPPITATACFHAQQCVEKCLKAYCAYIDHHIGKTHSLTFLIEICSKYDNGFLGFEAVAARLNKYSVEVRYPDDWREIPVEEAEVAVDNAENVMEFV